jgi:hypothetical protein
MPQPPSSKTPTPLPEFGARYRAMFGEPLPEPYRKVVERIRQGQIRATRVGRSWVLDDDQIAELHELLPRLIAADENRRQRSRTPDVIRDFVREIEAEAAA